MLVQWGQEEQRVGKIRRVHLGGFWLMEARSAGRLRGALTGRCTKLPALWYQAATGCNTLAQAKKISNVMK